MRLTQFNLDRWFFNNPNAIKPPELCRNQKDKIVYFKSEVDEVIKQIKRILQDPVTTEGMKLDRARQFLGLPMTDEVIRTLKGEQNGR
jgi:hypothetical protein